MSFPSSHVATTRPLAEQVARGAELVGMARMIGDQDDFQIWRHRRNNWLRQTAMVLAADERSGPTEWFREIASAGPRLSDWRDALRVEVDAVDAATDRLRSLLDS
jgi:hypothetical protein